MNAIEKACVASVLTAAAFSVCCFLLACPWCGLTCLASALAIGWMGGDMSDEEAEMDDEEAA